MDVHVALLHRLYHKLQILQVIRFYILKFLLVKRSSYSFIMEID